MSIVAGGVFALLQLRHAQRQRARESALQMLHSFQTPGFLNAINLVFELPEGLTKRELESRLGDRMTCLLVMFGTFESLGILVCRRDMDIRLVEGFFSGILVLSGRKLKKYLEEMRAIGGRDTDYEWYQWLFEAMIRREQATPPVPSFVAYRDWSA